MKKFIFFLLVLLLPVLAVLLSPYYTLYQIKRAYESGDYAKIITYIDIPAVQNSTKATLNARLDDTLSNNPQIAGLTALFPTVKDELTARAKQEISHTVHDAISQNNLSKLMKNDITPESKKLIAVWAFASNYVDYEQFLKDTLTHGIDTATKNQEPIVKERVVARFGKPTPSDVSTTYCGINCFAVMGSLSNQPVGATLHREGFITWRVKEIALP